MAPKRKTRANLVEFDPNKSDSDDENFEPEADNHPSRPRKKPRASHNGRSHRHVNKYRGSDIEEDDESSPSEEEGSFHEDEEDDEPLLNENTGRRVRKAAAKRTNYKESSDDDELGQDSDTKDEPQPKTQRPSKIVTVKFTPGLQKKQALANSNAAIGTRRTRARTAEAEGGDEDAELVELSNSGRHARAARGSKSRSPETAIRRRATRGTKGLKQPSPLPEVSQEDTPDVGESIPEPAADDAMDVEEAQEPATDLSGATAEDEPMQTVEANEDGDEDDDVPITRRTRGRHAADNAAGADNEGTSDNNQIGSRRRLTRGRSGTKKTAQEPSSDFEPGNDTEEDNDNDFASEGKDAEGENGDAESSPSRRGKGSPGKSRRSSRRPRNADESGEEEILDHEELVEELENLREDSQSLRRRRRRSPEILFEEKTRRRRVKKVDYSILPLNQANFEIDEDEAAAPISTPARRRGRANATVYTTRALHTLAGPFGGISGEGALAEGPWGNDTTAAAGNIESDSSDDEVNARSGGAGNLPTTPRGLLGGGGQLANSDGHANRIGTLAPNVGKVKDHKALADADPLGVDLTVNFSQVGGMEGHIEQLKEMVQLPLLYPDMFTRFHVTPPRGVLFHGPPGTGKTLLARALANSVGFGGRKITFYMRKGADALSKWVGEAEKQLRLLFEEARKTQPSIIFFDEIDGLAPVRSSKQEQIHASIVSTLLALMDGMDGRGQVIVIGATNRPDNIDPALRRPGRFDREFYFPLPDVEARKAILDIHTRDWGLSEDFKSSLAKDAKGYGGADLRALCTEAALNAIQRTYPQIYFSKEKLVVEPEKVNVQMTDFVIARKKIVPSSERSSTSGAASLPPYIEPLLRKQFKAITERLDNAFPRKPKVTALEEAMYEPYNDNDFGFNREQLYQEFDNSRAFRPRLLVHGARGMGQSYITAAILHYFEGVHVQNFDLPTIIGDSRPPEQVLTGLFTEVKRQKPSVIFIPNVDTWYSALSGPALTAFLGMLRSLHPTDPVMVLGITETELKDLDPELRRDLFGFSRSNVIEIVRPEKETREEYFARIIAHIRRKPNEFPDPVNRKKRQLEELPIAPAPPEKKLTKEEIHNEDVRYRQALNLMKVHLQPIMDQISKKYQKFRYPVILESQYQYLLDEADPNYIRADVADAPPRPFELAKDSDGYPGLRETATSKFFYNLDVNIIETRLANGYYWRPYEFLKDVRALKSDAESSGDRVRWLKASELLANVEVDVLDVDEKLRNMGINWERLYETHKKRREEREERARKKKAIQSVLDAARPGASNGGDPSQNGSHPTGLHTTTAQFRVIGDPPSNVTETVVSNAATNGTPIPARTGDEDVQMGGAEAHLSQPSPMRPPSQWPRMPPRSPIHSSVMATPGEKTRISQVSAVQSLPPGVSPSALANDASTTRTTDPSNRSSNFSQLTNGYHEQSGPETMPDTLPYAGFSQITSSDEQWPHSQAHAMKRGYLPQHSQPSLSQDSQNQASPAVAKSTHMPSMANLLNGPSPDEGPQSQRLSQPKEQFVEFDEPSAGFFLAEITKRTSGCTIEQLEQINRDLMSKLWETRGEHSRVKVLSLITRVFNDTMRDIGDMQDLLQLSQE
ncbi:putative 26S proteasome subunit YTA7 [Rosellinia necatrix]|uniref:Putative 26S proteasome subunit YTA7 n=1 Tax=Rosellinia necatrix TaxID=77044 RepID=A0A1W2TEK9_ROSNE|nr:putative 26S proteasome subunit YTA7 [Rosellinia necatrix]